MGTVVVPDGPTITHDDDIEIVEAKVEKGSWGSKELKPKYKKGNGVTTSYSVGPGMCSNTIGFKFSKWQHQQFRRTLDLYGS